MAYGTMVYNVIQGIIQEIYDGALAKTLLEKSPAYNRLDELGKVYTKEGLTEIRWPAVSESYGDAATILDGATLPAASIEQYVKAELPFSILIKTIRIGRLQQLASKNSNEFYRIGPGADLLATEINRVIPQIARTAHKQMVALTTASTATNDLVALGDSCGKTTNTYAGLNRTTATYWRPYVSHNSGTNRTLTEALMNDMTNNLRNNRESDITEIWAGNTAWNAIRTLINTITPSRNNDPAILRGGARMIYWENIPVVEMQDMDANAAFFLDIQPDVKGDGIELIKQHTDDFLIRPESTNSYDERSSIAAHFCFVVRNPWKQGALLDIQ